MNTSFRNNIKKGDFKTREREIGIGSVAPSRSCAVRRSGQPILFPFGPFVNRTRPCSPRSIFLNIALHRRFRRTASPSRHADSPCSFNTDPSVTSAIDSKAPSASIAFVLPPSSLCRFRHHFPRTSGCPVLVNPKLLPLVQVEHESPGSARCGCVGAPLACD
ncbi:hypothetical protein PIB30_075570 [Stylosanthes scabra]|uniref:Uncharacterized protein n=1 Tax=Stylosanthes scabra TaxID=79078 RepID=A0ABU6SS59_9FABA|nr:hypothetical protein [Stylosanthes scabra]